MVVDDDEGEENPQHKDSIQAEANAEEEVSSQSMPSTLSLTDSLSLM